MSVSVTEVHVRAKIVFVGLTVETPYVLSFNVTRSRGNMCATCSASMKIPSSSEVNGLGKIEIYAGKNSASNTIFTGYIRKITINPCREDSDFVIVNVSGRDGMHVLEGERYTRRQPAVSLSRYGMITSVVASNDQFREKFPSRIYNNEERLMGFPIMDGDSMNTKPPLPPAKMVDNESSTADMRMDVMNLGNIS